MCACVCGGAGGRTCAGGERFVREREIARFSHGGGCALYGSSACGCLDRNGYIESVSLSDFKLS